MVSVKLEKNDVVIRFPNGFVSNSLVEKFIERLDLEELAEKNKMTEKQADDLAEDINNEWWKNNKNSFLDGIKQ